jgi:manganese/zinc/iron transport system permease protein
VFITAHFFPSAYDALSLIVLIGAFCTAILGLWLIDKMESRLKVKNDAALCFVLSIFFGVGVLIASRLQFSHALWYKTVYIFLFGQAATMMDVHVIVYALLALLIICALFFLYRSVQISLFDKDYGKTVGVPIAFIDAVLFVLLIVAIIVGIRSVGVVLMAGMLIAPAVAARQLSNQLGGVFFLAGLIGALSGFFGNYLSVEIPQWTEAARSAGAHFSLPTGPMILLCASFFCLCAFLFAPKSGFIRRRIRAFYFQRECQRENVLKYLWKAKKGTQGELTRVLDVSSLTLFWMLFCLKKQGWIEERDGCFFLTQDGRQRATRIVRLHRLWELYLVHLGQGVEKVHRSAEEMEHILTPELEAELTLVLNDPKLDPHRQPIPSHEGML